MTGRSLWWHAALLVSGLIYGGFCAGFFPPPSGRLGGDYSYFLPLLLAGRYWIAANGPLAVPHFTPALCGGLPFLANPQSIFYSVPQLLSAIVDPQRAFLLTTVLFAWAGGIGMFLLLRQRFRTSLPAAALGGVVFLFNGFLLYRMANGQVPYHAVGLLPLLCWSLVMPVEGHANRFRRTCAATAGAAAILTYFVYGGAPHLIVPAAVAAIAVWLLLAIIDRPIWSFWPVGLAAGVIAAAAGAAKLAPSAALVGAFPRDELWIFPDFAAAASVLFRGLFAPWTLPLWWGKVETELGLGPVPLILIVLGAGTAVVRGGLRLRGDARAWLAAIALAAVLLLPLWINYGGPHFAAWLQSLPFIGESRLLTRWYFIYLPPVTIASALMLDFVLRGTRGRIAAALLGIAATIAAAVLVDTSYYRDTRYDPAPILAADRALHASGRPPPIAAIGPTGWYSPNDGLASGTSSFPCYEPLFGYNLQSFPWGVRIGPLSAAGHHLRNPACYIYGGANGCAPGDEFTPEQLAAEAAFASYRPFDYRRPWWQRAADIASLIGLAAILAGIGLGVLGRRRRAAPLDRRQPAQSVPEQTESSSPRKRESRGQRRAVGLDPRFRGGDGN